MTTTSVLVVDDEPDNLTTFRRVFRGEVTKHELEIILAGSGEEALEILRGRDVDVALVDYAMPGMNGLVFVEEASRLRPCIGFVFVTAHAELQELRDAKKAGRVVSVIIKPWDKETIQRWVTQAASLAAMRRAVQAMKRSTP